jgi:hypothetical protein
MWNWTCPKSPKVIWEHHTLKGLELMLTAHEKGLNIPGFEPIPGCGEIHDYWDDGIPCGLGKKCSFRYIPDPNGPDVV